MSAASPAAVFTFTPKSPRDAFASPTDIGEETITPRVEGARHIYPVRLKHHRHV